MLYTVLDTSFIDKKDTKTSFPDVYIYFVHASFTYQINKHD